MNPRPSAIWCIGRNYADHAKELGHATPSRPLLFMKNPASVIGDGEEIVIPEICRDPGPQVDWEGELAVIIGADARDLDRETALEAVSHYARTARALAMTTFRHNCGPNVAQFGADIFIVVAPTRARGCPVGVGP